MNTFAPSLLDLVDTAVTEVAELGLRRVETDRWERRSAQVWYRITARRGSDHPDLADNHLQVHTALVVPLLDRVLAPLGTGRGEADGTVGGNLLVLAGAGNERTFEFTASSRRGKLVARLKAPVIGTTGYRQVNEDEFVSVLDKLLLEHYLPLARLSNWAQLADVVAARGAALNKAGLLAEPQATEGVLRWAAGGEAHGRQLLQDALADRPTELEQILNALTDRFQAVTTG